jgi:hypothetical protein
MCIIKIIGMGLGLKTEYEKCEAITVVCTDEHNTDITHELEAVPTFLCADEFVHRYQLQLVITECDG